MEQGMKPGMEPVMEPGAERRRESSPGRGAERGNALVGGRRLAYSVRGSGPALLLIAGLGTGGWIWDRQAPVFARRFRTISYDHRGTGASDPAAPGYGIGDLAADAVGLLGALGVERAHVIGISMGGFVAETVAIEHPERVGRLVLCATSFGGRSAIAPDPAVWRDYIGLRGRPPEEAARLALRYHFGPGFPKEQPRLAALAAQDYLLRAEPADTVAAQALACTRFDESARVGSIRAATLVCHGTEDLILPAENARLLAARIPGAKLVLYEGAGHAFIIERAREFSRVAMEFLSERV